MCERPALAAGHIITMTKADLIEEVSNAINVTRKDSEAVIETIFESIIESLCQGDKVEIRGFGSFRIRQRESRTGRNPKTGEKVEVPARKIPYFKPSKDLKDNLNPSGAKAGASTARRSS